MIMSKNTDELRVLKLLASVESNIAMTRDQQAAVCLHEKWARESSDYRNFARI